MAHDGTVLQPRFLFVPGAYLDWEPLWKAGFLPAPYKPVHPLYQDKEMLSRYGLAESDFNLLLKESGVHGFDRNRDRELVERAAYHLAEEQLKGKGHNPLRVADHTGLGYDYVCQGHCDQVFEVKGMGEPRDIILEGSEAKAALDKREKYILVCVYNLPCPLSQVGYREIPDPGTVGSLSAQVSIEKNRWLNWSLS